MLYRVEGIVIRSMDYGENHKIVTLITNSAGKVGVLIRGAKKVRSKHASLAQPFTYGEFTFVRNQGLGTFHYGEPISSHHALRTDLDLSAHASYIAELMDRAIQDEEVNVIHFEYLKACFAAFSEGKDFEVVTQLFEMKLLELAGYAPVLNECIHCGNRVPPFKISFYSGGIVCSRCSANDATMIEVSDSALKLLRLYKQMDIRRLGNITVSAATKKELNIIMRGFIDAQLNIRLKTRSFLDNLSKLV